MCQHLFLPPSTAAEASNESLRDFHKGGVEKNKVLALKALLPFRGIGMSLQTGSFPAPPGSYFVLTRKNASSTLVQPAFS